MAPFSNGGFFPLINGSDTNFSQPFVLTYPKGGYPTDKPRPQLKVTNLTGSPTVTVSRSSARSVQPAVEREARRPQLGS